jgi:hypothetical protein
MRDGKVIAQHNVGYADLAAKRAVDNETIFHWGSITKMLTAVAVLQLRAEGKLTLDDKVTRYVPELRRTQGVMSSCYVITGVYSPQNSQRTQRGCGGSSFSELQNCFSPLPLSALCELCGEYTGAMS